MKFLKTLKPSLISTFMPKSKEKRDKTPQLPPKKQNPERKEHTRPKIFDNQSKVEYKDAQCFILALREASVNRQKHENQKKRKINLFEKVQIQPHYLEEANEPKMLNFQFQLGSDIFLDRTEHLYQQVAEINKVVQQVLETRKYDIFSYFDSINDLQRTLDEKIKLIAKQRNCLKQIREHKTYRIYNLAQRKKVIKQKIKLLRSVKQKNEAAFQQIDNIDKAFATEQSRSKLYIKINKLTELEKSKYVCTIKNKLISIARNNGNMVQKKIYEWVQGKLSEKQIEKLAFMIYFINTAPMYKDNSVLLDYQSFDKNKLKAEIKKIFTWKKFNYVKEFATHERIHLFLNELIKEISQKESISK